MPKTEERNPNIDLNKKTRYGTIDGLRGLAALSVVIFHLSGALADQFSEVLPNVINIVMSYGFLGVPMFFVISGFAISLSIGKKKITTRYFGNFILRRSIRLDITYWVAIALAISLMWVKLSFLGQDTEMPSAKTVLIHMFYLQDLLEVKPLISVVYWTLCMEVQLYITYILIVWVSQKIALVLKNSSQKILIILILCLGLVSLCYDQKLLFLNKIGLFFPYWHYFLMGVLLANVAKRRASSQTILFLWLILECLFLLLGEPTPYAIAGISTTFSIWLIWYRGQLSKLFTGRIFSFLGKISYSLYLIHSDIGWKFISVCKLLLGEYINGYVSILVFFLSILLSVGAAYILYFFVEAPSLRLCNRLKENRIS